MIVHLKMQKIEVYVFRTYSATYSTVFCHFRTALLNKLPPFLNKQPKNVLSLQKKSSTRQFESKFSLRSFVFSLHRQPMKVLREPLRRHLLRPRAVTIGDRRRSSIKTQKEHYRAADKSIKLSFKTYRTMINYSIVKRSVNANLIEINQAKSRINQARRGQDSTPSRPRTISLTS